MNLGCLALFVGGSCVLAFVACAGDEGGATAVSSQSLPLLNGDLRQVPKPSAPHVEKKKNKKPPKAARSLVWVDATGTPLHVVAAHLPPSLTPQTSSSSGGSSSTSSSSSSGGGNTCTSAGASSGCLPAPFGTLYIADDDGYVWQVNPTGEPATQATLVAIDFSTPDCTGTPYFHPSAVQGSTFGGVSVARFVFRAPDQGYYALPDTTIALGSVAVQSTRTASGECVALPAQEQRDVAPLSAAEAVAAPPATFFQPPAHPEFL